MKWALVRCRLTQLSAGYYIQIDVGASVNRLVAGSNPARGANPEIRL